MVPCSGNACDHIGEHWQRRPGPSRPASRSTPRLGAQALRPRQAASLLQEGHTPLTASGPMKDGRRLRIYLWPCASSPRRTSASWCSTLRRTSIDWRRRGSSLNGSGLGPVGSGGWRKRSCTQVQEKSDTFHRRRDQALVAATISATASTDPLASPFSKSPSMLAI